MTKLPLHERLREWAEQHIGNCLFEDDDISIRMFPEDALGISNEIVRDYIPKAVDANGKPWEIGDACDYVGKLATVAGYAENGYVCINIEESNDCSFVYGGHLYRHIERTPIEKLRDEIASYAHSHVPDSVLDGWVKDLDAYIDQQGKDE